MTDYNRLGHQTDGFTILDSLLRTSVDWADRGAEADLRTPPPSVINAYFAELYQRKVRSHEQEYFARNQSGFWTYGMQT